MNDPASKASIRKFVKAYKGQVDISEIAEDLDSFQNFNEFFYRKLKPGARPIASPDDDGVLVSAADCRLMTYGTAEQSTQFWIKVCAHTWGCVLHYHGTLQPSLFATARCCTFHVAREVDIPVPDGMSMSEQVS